MSQPPLQPGPSQATVEPGSAQQPAPARAGFMARYQALMAQYGALALGVYLTIFVGVVGTTALAINLGLDLRGLGRWLGVDLGGGGGATVGASLGMGWIVAKATQVLRILATLAITPVLARWLGRAPLAAPAPSPPEGAATGAAPPTS